MDLHFSEVRSELLIKKTDQSATFEDVYAGTHIAYCVSKDTVFFVAFDSGLVHLLYMQLDNRRIEETFAGIECTQHVIQSTLDFERRKGIYPHFHYFFVERPCLEEYIQYSTNVTRKAEDRLNSCSDQQFKVIYTDRDYEFFYQITRSL